MPCGARTHRALARSVHQALSQGPEKTKVLKIKVLITAFSLSIEWSPGFSVSTS